MIKLRDSNKDDKEYKCYLRYDKLSAGGLLYRLNDKQDNIVRNSLKFISYNIEGLKSAQFNNILSNFLVGFEFITLQETWISNESEFSDYLDGYSMFALKGYKFGSGGRRHGGISVFIKNNLFKYAERICCSSKLAVYISFPGYLFNTHLNVVVICAYIPPENSTFYSHEDEDSGIYILCDEILDIQESSGEFYIILTGD